MQRELEHLSKLPKSLNSKGLNNLGPVEIKICLMIFSKVKSKPPPSLGIYKRANLGTNMLCLSITTFAFHAR